jgi:hypothetical protein
MKKSNIQLLNETKEKMRKLYEYSFYRQGVYEDDDDTTEETPDSEGQDTQMDGDNMGMEDPNAMGGPDGMGMEDPNAMGEEPAGGVDGANLAPNAGMDNQSGDMEDPNAMGGLDDMGMEDPNAMDGVGPDDDVVDITELTDAQEDMQQSQNDMRQSQEEIANQMSDVDEKLVTLLKVVDKFNSALEANDKKIADLKQELIKRTPTEEETMNVRLNAGGNPFAQKPNEFWEKFEDINNHYNITSNNKAPQFQIRKSDIDNFNEKIMDAEFDKIPQSLYEYFVK